MQIAAVVAAVLVFSYFDPFGFLSPKKKTLKNTPIQVRSIKEIGQLITAEYYGEVIASLGEVVNVKQDSVLVEFRSITDDLHQDFLAAIDSLRKDTLPNRKEKIYDHFASENPDIVNNYEFEAYLYYIYEKIKDRTYNKKDLKKRLDEGSKRILIKRFYFNRKNWYEKLIVIKTDQFQDVKEANVKKADERKYRRSRLVIIGRGWVKAGFDFEKFTDRNFKYNPSRKTIHFIGLQPQVLSATINPWFIPEEGVEGFEFLIAERGARLNPEYTYLVKKRCLDKLKFQADEKEILKRAQENAETNLKGFFSLLLNEEIKKVTFHTDLLDYTRDVLLADSVIRNEEVITIDNTILEYFKSNRKNKNRFEKIDAFIDSLRTVKFQINDATFQLNTYSALLFHIVRNRRIDSADLVRVKERNENVLLDSAWQSKLFVEMKRETRIDSVQKAAQFNDSLKSDLEQFFDDLKRSCKMFEMEADTGYFDGKGIEVIKLRSDSLEINSCIPPS